MAITASLVKELRQNTGVGMMECKQALIEAGGDVTVAAEILHKAGFAKADKKSGRIAAEGLVAIASDNQAVAMVEVNSETDFLAKSSNFIGFADQVAAAVLANNPADMATLNDSDLDGFSVEVTRQNLITKLGENISVRRFARIDGEVTAAYSHGGKIGVIVGLQGGTAELAKDLAMHIAAMKPVAIDESGIDADLLAKEKEILIAQAQASGKPAGIIEKMTIGKVKKFIAEITLLGQSFVKDSSTTVGKLLAVANAKVISFHRLEVGEGIEKKQENFANEVMAQIK